eukprot:scaffold731_cov261-Pinguiococcus_pyrenoidosus.AAC.53
MNIESSPSLRATCAGCEILDRRDCLLFLNPANKRVEPALVQLAAASAEVVLCPEAVCSPGQLSTDELVQHVIEGLEELVQLVEDCRGHFVLLSPTALGRWVPNYVVQIDHQGVLRCLPWIEHYPGATAEAKEVVQVVEKLGLVPARELFERHDLDLVWPEDSLPIPYLRCVHRLSHEELPTHVVRTLCGDVLFQAEQQLRKHGHRDGNVEAARPQRKASARLRLWKGAADPLLLCDGMKAPPPEAQARSRDVVEVAFLAFPRQCMKREAITAPHSLHRISQREDDLELRLIQRKLEGNCSRHHVRHGAIPG